jgi:uracil permease
MSTPVTDTNYNFRAWDIILGICGMSFSTGAFTVKGIGLAGIAGVLLNLILPGKKKNDA